MRLVTRDKGMKERRGTRARRKEVTKGKLKKRRDLIVKKQESMRVNVKMSRSAVRGSKSLAHH